MLIAAAALMSGIGFTARIAEDSTLGVTTPATIIEPAFHVSKLRDEIRLHGHTISVAQERQLLNLTAATFPDHTITSRFESHGLVPSYWEPATIQILGALTSVESGTASLTGSELRFDVVTTNHDAWQSHLQTLRSDLTGVDNVRNDSIVVGSEDVDTLCRDAYAGMSVGAINFLESTAEFRPSAYPRLERLTALVAACRGTTIRITGHSDSSGEESLNLALSLQRAEAVTQFLASNGIAGERLLAEGMGSAQPVASNESRYGRSLNRRIEFEFQPD